MIVLCALIVLFAIFFFGRKHAGPAYLAVIAGLAVYQLFGPNLVNIVTSIAPSAHATTVEQILYLILIIFFPLLLYFRSDRGGLHGLLRLLEAGIFAILVTALISDPLASLFGFDAMAREIANFVADIQGYVVLVGIAAAYIDILFYRKPHPD